MSHIVYAVRDHIQGHKCGYAVKHPVTGLPVSNVGLTDGYCCEPITLGLEDATVLAAQMTEQMQSPWRTELAPSPCPNCGRVIWANDLDFCYSCDLTFTKWRAGCNEHDGGCGYIVKADTFDAVMAMWNERKKD